ncbi:response regulator [Pseudomarimonas arenosa]|uniref:Sensory/regulatory protein RpfC n=1 Tax=Pseudomarimonas arenosa TaxID=2774145 RepID=A0AAW3ZMA5_9GAMM|nr:response regulator [Pseudomarimonas arenosa]MBD8526610.1 response regulator [Pseudomarimonas arenosa]
MRPQRFEFVNLKAHGRWLWMFLLVLLVPSLVALGVGEHERQQTLREMEEQLARLTELRVRALERQIERRRRDVLFLADTPPVPGIGRALLQQGFDAEENSTTELWQSRLETIFQAFAWANPDVLQLRLIGRAGRGRELVRVNRHGDSVETVAESALQSKGDRDYFLQTSQLPRGQAYVSKIDLNREYGEITLPHTPVLRIGTPVHGPDGNAYGAVLLNLDATVLLDTVATDPDSPFALYVINDSGDFLVHPESGKAYGFEFGKPQRWQDEFIVADGNASRLERAEAGGRLVRFYRRRLQLDSSRPDHHATLILMAPERLVEHEVAAARWAAASASGGVTVLAALLAGWFQRLRSREHQKQALLAALVSAAQDPIVATDLNGRIRSWNRSAHTLFGIDTSSAFGQDLAALIAQGEARDHIRSAQARIRAGVPVVTLVTECRGAGRATVPVAFTLAAIRNSQGPATGIATTLRDISAQVRHEEEIQELNRSLEQQVEARTANLRRMSALHAAIVANAGSAIIASDCSGRISLFNPEAERLLGYAAPDVVGKRHISEFQDPHQLAERATQLGLSAPAGPPQAIEILLRAESADHNREWRRWLWIDCRGHKVPVLLVFSALSDDSGQTTGYIAVATDVSALERKQQQLSAAHSRFQTAVDAAQLGVWTWRLTDNHLVWNDRMFEIYDWPLSLRKQGLSYEHWRSRIHPDDLEDTERRLQQALAGECRFDPVFRICLPNGRIRHIQAASIVEHDEYGRPQVVTGINRDISDQLALEQGLREAKQAADAANRSKSEFLANMSHEIRTPMNAVLGMLHLLGKTKLDDRQRDCSDKAKQAAQALLGVLNDILDVSKVESGMLELEETEFRIEQVLEKVIALVAHRAQSKDLEFVVRDETDADIQLIGDPLRLTQVLVNLAGNAVKFTETGEVCLELQQVEADDSNVCIEFHCRDTGIGMTEEQQSRLFQAFAQADSSITRRFGGTGLGLVISRQLVELMGGQLEFESEPGRGTEFHFRLYFGRAEPIQAESSKHEPTACNVLIVEDNPSARQVMQELIQQFGWEPLAVPSAERALDEMRKQEAPRFDVALIDWKLPGMDGLTLGANIRQLYSERSPRMILCTAFGDRVFRDSKARQLFDGFLNKPVTASVLFDSIGSVLGRARLAEQSTTDERLGDLCGVRLLLVDDNEINRQIALEILQAVGAEVDWAENGRQALSHLSQFELPHLVLMDVQMPVMDGLEATRRIRKQYDPAQLPVLAMTAHALKEELRRCLDAGMQGRVVKPVDPALLISTVLRFRRVDTEGQSQATEPPAASGVPTADARAPACLPNLRGVDTESGLRYAAGHTELYCRMLQRFVDKYADAASELQTMLAEQRPSEAEHLAHSMRGMAATLGAELIAEQAGEIEAALGSDASLPDLAPLRRALHALVEDMAGFDPSKEATSNL